MMLCGQSKTLILMPTKIEKHYTYKGIYCDAENHTTTS